MISSPPWLLRLRRGTFRVGITLKGNRWLAGISCGATLACRSRLLLRKISLTLWTYGHFHHLHHSGSRVAEQLRATDPVFAAAYLLSHGAVKIVLAIALWMNRLWAYPLAIFVFGAFAVYQVFRLERAYSIGLLLLTISDAVIIWLTLLEYRDQKRLHALRTGRILASGPSAFDCLRGSVPTHSRSAQNKIRSPCGMPAPRGGRTPHPPPPAGGSSPPGRNSTDAASLSSHRAR